MSREIVETVRTKVASYTLEKIMCGKSGCTRCPHGPYWYGRFWHSGRIVVKYIGKKFHLFGFDPGYTREYGKKRIPVRAEIINEMLKAGENVVSEGEEKE